MELGILTKSKMKIFVVSNVKASYKKSAPKRNKICHMFFIFYFTISSITKQYFTEPLRVIFKSHYSCLHNTKFRYFRMWIYGTCSHFSTSEIDIIYRTTKCFELTGRALVSVFVFIDFTRKYMIIHSNENWKLYWWRKKKNSLIFAVLFNTDNLIQRNYL